MKAWFPMERRMKGWSPRGHPLQGLCEGYIGPYRGVMGFGATNNEMVKTTDMKWKLGRWNPKP